jgi:hypothetical protein
MWHADRPPYDGLACQRHYPDQQQVESLDQEETMTRSSKLSVRSRCGNVQKTQTKVGRLLHAYYSSMLEQPVPSELTSLVVQLLAIEARNDHSTEGAIEVLQLAAAPIGRTSNPTDRLP